MPTTLASHLENHKLHLHPWNGPQKLADFPTVAVAPSVRRIQVEGAANVPSLCFSINGNIGRVQQPAEQSKRLNELGNVLTQVTWLLEHGIVPMNYQKLGVLAVHANDALSQAPTVLTCFSEPCNLATVQFANDEQNRDAPKKLLTRVWHALRAKTKVLEAPAGWIWRLTLVRVCLPRQR